MGVAKHFRRRPGRRATPSGACADPFSSRHRPDDGISFAFKPICACRRARILRRVLWLQGFSEQAAHAAETSVAEAHEAGHAVSLCLALALAACPIALWVGDLAGAAHYARMLLDHSREHSLPLWREFGARFQRVVVIKGGELRRDSPNPNSAFDR